jgi:dienelactone hydrolase
LLLYYAGPFFTANRPSIAWPKIKTWVTALRESQDPAEKDLPIFAAGFCWGGKFVTLLTHDESTTSTGAPLMDAGFAAHPSMLDMPGDIEKVGRPLSIAVGTKDMVFPPKQAEVARKILEAKREKDGLESELVVIEGAGHGFAVRADPGNEKVVEQAKMAEEQAIRWFEKFLKQ